MERKIHTEEEEKQYYSDTKKAERGYHEAVEVKDERKNEQHSHEASMKKAVLHFLRSGILKHSCDTLVSRIR